MMAHDDTTKSSIFTMSSFGQRQKSAAFAIAKLGEFGELDWKRREILPRFHISSMVMLSSARHLVFALMTTTGKPI